MAPTVIAGVQHFPDDDIADGDGQSWRSDHKIAAGRRRFHRW